MDFSIGNISLPVWVGRGSFFIGILELMGAILRIIG
jgi:hypothetical protein